MREKNKLPSRQNEGGLYVKTLIFDSVAGLLQVIPSIRKVTVVSFKSISQTQSLHSGSKQDPE